MNGMREKEISTWGIIPEKRKSEFAHEMVFFRTYLTMIRRVEDEELAAVSKSCHMPFSRPCSSIGTFVEETKWEV